MLEVGAVSESPEVMSDLLLVGRSEPQLAADLFTGI